MELGSEFSLDLSELSICKNNIYDYLKEYSCAYFDSGRSALKALLKELNGSGGMILLPEYICESVINCFKGNIQYYKINPDFSINIEDFNEKAKKGNVSIIYLMHYFGHVQPDDILQTVLQTSNQNSALIIEDTTHSIFSKSSTIGDYMICSLRKWMPVPGVGVLYSKDRDVSNVQRAYKSTENNQKALGMLLKDAYLKDALDCNDEYRKIFIECEHKLDLQSKIYLANDFSKYIMACVDINKLKEIRKANYKYIKDNIEKIGFDSQIEMSNEETPFSYIIRSENRDELRKYLIDNKVYCAVHWPDDGIKTEDRLQFLDNSKNCLSLPIDQRYDFESMDYLYRVLKDYKQ